MHVLTPFRSVSALDMSTGQPMPACPRRLGAFTLLELLTVIAVIAILAGLLLPAIARGKSSAQQIACMSNLRQLGLATQMYWDDNSGYAFRWRGSATNGGQLYWFGWLQDGAEGVRRFDAAPGALSPYLGDHHVVLCPALNYSLAQFKLKATGASYGYGYNLRLSAKTSEPAVNVNRLARPSELVLFADSAQVNTFQPPASPQNPMLEEFYYVHTNELTVHFRHRERANIVCCDGHVAADKPIPGSIDLRLPKANVGQLRPEILQGD